MATKDEFLEKFERCNEAIRKLADETDQGIIERLWDYTGKKHPDLILSLLVAEKGIEEHWGKDFTEFEKHLVEYYKMHVRIVNRCRNNI